MSQDFIQNYLIEVNLIRKEIYYYTSKFNIEWYNEQLQELYIESFNKENFIPKTKEEIYHELCGDARDSILQYQINETEESRNNRYKEYCHNIWFFNLDEEEIEEEEFETENDHPLNTYALYLDRLYKNPCTTKELLEKTHYEDIFMIDKSNKNPKESDFIPVPIVKPWGLIDIAEKVYQNPLKEFCSFNREENIMKSTKNRYFRDGKVMSNGLSKSIIANKEYAKKTINTKNRSIHRDLFKAFIGANYNLEMINHVDGDIHNNDLINFEASNRSHNGFHGIYELGKGTNIKIKRYDLENELNIYVFDSITDAAKNAEYSLSYFAVNIKTKGFCNSKNKKYRYVYENSTYIPSKRIVLDKLPKDCKQLLKIRQDGKEDSEYGKRNNNIYYSSREGEMYKEFEPKKYYKMKTNIQGGYVIIRVTDNNGNRKSYLMQRIVLIVHLDGKTGRLDYEDYTKLVVDHKNRIRNDNRVDNLQFVTILENNLLARGFKALIIVSVERCTLEQYRYNKSKGIIMFDALFVDASVANEFLNSGINHIQSATANNEVMFNYIFDYVSDEFYQKYKNNQSNIHVIKGPAPLYGEMKSLKTDKTFTFDGISDAESVGKLEVKEQQMYSYYYYHISNISGIELSNGTIEKKFLFAKIKQENNYKISSNFRFENITIDFLDEEGKKGKRKKCWITSNINGIVDRREFTNCIKAEEMLNLSYRQIKNYITNLSTKDKFEKILYNGQILKRYICCIYTEDNVYKCLKPPIQEFEKFKCIVNDCSQIKFRWYQIIEKNAIFESLYPCKYQK